MKLCSKCKVKKSLELFFRDKNRKDDLACQCKLCMYEYRKEWVIKNRNRINQYAREIRKKNRDMINKWRRDWERKRHRKLKELVLSHYSKGIPSCNCCGEKNIIFLTIDHINNDGAERRRMGEKHGHKLYAKLIKHDFPKEFQVLCMNCNWGKYQNGGICPHQNE